MPKELARVVGRYNNLQAQVKPLLHELAQYGNDYIMMRDTVSILVDQLAEQLKNLGVKSAADPRAARDHGVMDTLEEIEITRAAAQLKAGTLMSRESTSSRCEQLAAQLLLYGRPIPPEEVVARIEAVGTTELARIARPIFSSRSATSTTARVHSSISAG